MTAPSRSPASNSPDHVDHLRALLGREHAALAEFLLALAEFDRARRWQELGYTGLFPFLHRELQLSKSAAFFRKTAADLIQRFPEVIEPIRDGRLCLTSVVELAKVLTPGNRTEVLPRFFQCSKQEAKVVSAELSPHRRPLQRAVVTELPTLTAASSRSAPAVAPEHRASDVALEQGGDAAHQEDPSRAVRPDEPNCPERATAQRPRDEAVPLAERTIAHVPRDEAVPLTADLRRLHVTVSKRFLDKLEAARSALSHARPGASIEATLEAGLDLVLARDAKKKGFVARPRPAGSTPGPGSRHVPASVRRAVWERDGGRCQWPLASGGICGSTFRVELDHTRPWGRGGRSTIDNLRLLCRAHNDLAARNAYGDGLMDRYTRGRAGRVAGRGPPCDAWSGLPFRTRRG